jgi:hypothetical protein
LQIKQHGSSSYNASTLDPTLIEKYIQSKKDDEIRLPPPEVNRFLGFERYCRILRIIYQESSQSDTNLKSKVHILVMKEYASALLIRKMILEEFRNHHSHANFINFKSKALELSCKRNRWSPLDSRGDWLPLTEEITYPFDILAAYKVWCSNLKDSVLVSLL